MDITLEHIVVFLILFCTILYIENRRLKLLKEEQDRKEKEFSEFVNMLNEAEIQFFSISTEKKNMYIHNEKKYSELLKLNDDFSTIHNKLRYNVTLNAKNIADIMYLEKDCNKIFEIIYSLKKL